MTEPIFHIDHYYTLPQIISFMGRKFHAPRHWDDEGYELPATTKQLYVNPQVVKKIAEQLSQKGFHRFRLLRDGDGNICEGSYAIILQTVDNQLLRLSLPKDDKATEIHDPAEPEYRSKVPGFYYGVPNARIPHPAFLQAIDTMEVQDNNGLLVRAEILPWVRIIPRHDNEKVMPLLQALRQSGITVSDLTDDTHGYSGNAGIMDLPDGHELVLLVDPGYAMFTKPIPEACQGPHLKDWLAPDGKTFLQSLCDPRLNTGPSMVASQDHIARNEKKAGAQAFTAMIKDGLYPEEAWALMADAADISERIGGKPGSYERVLKIKRNTYDHYKAPNIISNSKR